LRSSGRKLVSALVTASEALASTVSALHAEASRSEVVEVLGGLEQLAAIAGLVHRLGPGVRVM